MLICRPVVRGDVWAQAPADKPFADGQLPIACRPMERGAAVLALRMRDAGKSVDDILAAIQ